MSHRGPWALSAGLYEESPGAAGDSRLDLILAGLLRAAHVHWDAGLGPSDVLRWTRAIKSRTGTPRSLGIRSDLVSGGLT